MKKLDVVDFDTALASSNKTPKILLGNGFSVAWQPQMFCIRAFWSEQIFHSAPIVRKAFSLLCTSDFEIVMNVLRHGASMAELYETCDRDLVARLKQDSESVKDILISTIAGNHPDRPSDITDEQCGRAKAFLSQFDAIYTLNYDLLAYWALMRDDVEPKLEFDDGFRQPEEGPEDWVVWDSSHHNQNLFYLHGGLHVYQSGPEIRKYTWCNTGVALMDQIRAALDDNKFPLYVAEGTWEDKLTRIRRSDFLGRSRRSFNSIGGSLFVYGMSMSENDTHILDAIVTSKVEQLFVSLYGEIDSESNRDIRRVASTLVEKRKGVGSSRRPRPLEVKYYKAETATVWH